MKSVCDALTKRAARSALAVSARGAGAGPILTPTDRQREAFFKHLAAPCGSTERLGFNFLALRVETLN